MDALRAAASTKKPQDMTLEELCPLLSADLRYVVEAAVCLMVECADEAKMQLRPENLSVLTFDAIKALACVEAKARQEGQFGIDAMSGFIGIATALLKMAALFFPDGPPPGAGERA